MRKILFLILCTACLSFVRAADFSADARGTTGAQFLELPVGARAIAMGSAYSSISGDPFSAYYNPAGLACIDKLSVGLMHAIYFQDISYEYGVFAVPIRELGVVAVSAQYLSVDKLTGIDKTGVLTGDTIKPNDTALSVIYAKQFGMVDFGVSAKYVKSQILNSASTFAGDAGMQTKVGNYALGLSILNVGKGLKFHEEKSSLPTTGRIGISTYLIPKCLLSVDVIAPKGANPLMAAGAEYALVSNQNINMAVRAGYNTRNVSSRLGGITGINAGVGLDFSGIAVDYAWSLYGDLGSTHRLSLTAKFGGAQKAAKNIPVAAAIVAPVPIQTNPPVVNPWLAQLKNPDAQKRRKAAFELGKVRATEAVLPLLDLLEDESDKVCGTAILALGQISDKRSVMPVIERLDDASPYVRTSAAKALGQFKDKRAVKPLKDLLQDEFVEVRKAAKNALQQIAQVAP